MLIQKSYIYILIYEKNHCFSPSGSLAHFPLLAWLENLVTNYIIYNLINDF